MSLLKDEGLDWLSGESTGSFAILHKMEQAKGELREIEMKIALSPILTKELQVKKEEIQERIKRLKKMLEKKETEKKEKEMEKEGENGI